MRYVVPMRVMQWLCMPMLAAAILVPYGMYLPLMWGILACCFSLMTIGLFKIIIESRTRVAGWFAASFAVTFVAALAEAADEDDIAGRRVYVFMDPAYSAYRWGYTPYGYGYGYGQQGYGAL